MRLVIGISSILLLASISYATPPRTLVDDLAEADLKDLARLRAQLPKEIETNLKLASDRIQLESAADIRDAATSLSYARILLIAWSAAEARVVDHNRKADPNLEADAWTPLLKDTSSAAGLEQKVAEAIAKFRTKLSPDEAKTYPFGLTGARESAEANAALLKQLATLAARLEDDGKYKKVRELAGETVITPPTAAEFLKLLPAMGQSPAAGGSTTMPHIQPSVSPVDQKQIESFVAKYWDLVKTKSWDDYRRQFADETFAKEIIDHTPKDLDLVAVDLSEARYSIRALTADSFDVEVKGIQIKLKAKEGELAREQQLNFTLQRIADEMKIVRPKQ